MDGLFVRGPSVKLLLKLIMSTSLAVILGVGTAGYALWFEAKQDGASATSLNPYARAAYRMRNFLPGDTTGETRP